jgi:hypothetical protein
MFGRAEPLGRSACRPCRERSATPEAMRFSGRLWLRSRIGGNFVTSSRIDCFAGYRNIGIRVKLRAYFHDRILQELPTSTYSETDAKHRQLPLFPKQLLSGPMLDGTMRRPHSRRLGFRVPLPLCTGRCAGPLAGSKKEFPAGRLHGSRAGASSPTYRAVRVSAMSMVNPPLRPQTQCLSMRQADRQRG